MASYKKFSVKDKKMRIYSKVLKPNEIFPRKKNKIFSLRQIYRFLESFPPFCNSIFVLKQIYSLPSCLLRHLVQQKFPTDTYFSWHNSYS